MPQRQLVRAIRSSPCAFIELPPLFLAPALQTPFRASIERCSAFSTATALSYPRRDKNKSRGVSAIRMTGPKHKLAAMKYPLPQPVLNPTRRSKAATNDNHGLWQFFPDSKMAMATPEEEFAFGRAWTYAELCNKSWDELHKLWWICVKERNRIATSAMERDRVHAGYGDHESGERETAVKKTQKGIRDVLADRWSSWEDARQLWIDDVRPEDPDDTEHMDAEELDGDEERNFAASHPSEENAHTQLDAPPDAPHVNRNVTQSQ